MVLKADCIRNNGQRLKILCLPPPQLGKHISGVDPGTGHLLSSPWDSAGKQGLRIPELEECNSRQKREDDLGVDNAC